MEIWLSHLKFIVFAKTLIIPIEQWLFSLYSFVKITQENIPHPFSEKHKIPSLKGEITALKYIQVSFKFICFEHQDKICDADYVNMKQIGRRK